MFKCIIAFFLYFLINLYHKSDILLNSLIYKNPAIVYNPIKILNKEDGYEVWLF